MFMIKYPLMFLLLELLLASYYRGLFFEDDLLNIALTTNLLGLWAFYLDTKNAKTPLWKYGILLIPFTYLLSMPQSMSIYLDKFQFLRYFSFALIFLIIVISVKNHLSMKWLQLTLLLTGLWVTWFGFFNLFGQAQFRDAVLGDRLTSVFQYPNTYAAFLIAIFLSALLYNLKLERYSFLLPGLVLVPALYSIILTYSRGAWLLAPIVYLVVLFLLKPSRQFRFLAGSLAVALPGFGLLPLFFKSLQGKEAAMGYGLLIGATVVSLVLMAGATHLLSRNLERQERHDTRWWAQVIIPLTIVLLLAVSAGLLLKTDLGPKVLPKSVMDRISTINENQHSVLERQTFNRDAMKIFRDYPIFGAGGGAWKVLWQKYQNNPYISSQSHNFYSQILVEGGIVGALIFMFVFGLLFYKGIRLYFTYHAEQQVNQLFFVAIVITLLGHSMIDFDMSYGYISMLLFASLAGMVVNQHEFDKEPLLAKRGQGKLHKGKKGTVAIEPKWTLNKVLSWGLLAVILFATVVDFRYVLAANRYNQGSIAIQQNNANQAMTYFKSAMDLNPTKVDYIRTYASIQEQFGRQLKDEERLKEAFDLYQHAIDLEPTNPDLYKSMAQAQERSGQFGLSQKFMRQAIDNAPWDQSLYDQYFRLTAEAAKLNQITKEEAKTALTYYDRIPSMLEHLKTLPKGQNQGRPFGFTDTMNQNAEKLRAFVGK